MPSYVVSVAIEEDDDRRRCENSAQGPDLSVVVLNFGDKLSVAVIRGFTASILIYPVAVSGFASWVYGNRLWETN